jgi:hypothetical protein
MTTKDAPHLARLALLEEW